MDDVSTTSRELDSAYKGFPSFREWLATTVDATRWQRYASILTERSKASAETLQRARQIVTRAAAIDTGAIEGLYDVDRGFTFTVATEATIWEAAMDAKGPHVRPLFEAHLAAYEYVLDLATRSEPVTEKVIRSLHEELCRPQETYSVATSIGVQEQPLPKGEYKHAPNHVRTRDGAMHSYAPVDLTPAEMHRFVAELNSEAFTNAHPVLQAAFAHYAFVAVHPFADGNGRVARALASVYTYRAQSVPYLILFDQRRSYYDALAAADKGDFQAFVDFSLARVLDAIKLVDESLRAALVPDPEIIVAGLQKLYTARAGYTQPEIEKAGQDLLKLVAAQLTQLAPGYEKGPVSISVSLETGPVGLPTVHYRSASGGLGHLQVSLTSPPPASIALTRRFQIELPNDRGVDDDVTLRNPYTGETFTARMDEISPASAALQMRANMFARRLFAEGLSELRTRAEAALRSKG